MRFCKSYQMKIVSTILAIQLREPKTLYLESINSSILIYAHLVLYLLPSHGFLAIIMVIWGVSFEDIEKSLNIKGVIISKARMLS